MRITMMVTMILILPAVAAQTATNQYLFNQADEMQEAVVLNVSNRAEARFNFNLAGIETEEKVVNGTTFQAVIPLTASRNKWGETAEEGMPELPVISQLIGIPDQSGVVLHINSSEFRIIENIEIMPSQPSAPEGSTETFPFIMNEEAYQRNEFYPQNIIELGEPAVFRDLRLMSYTINPVQYNPVTRQLKVYTNIDYNLTFEGSDNRNVKVRRNNRISESFLPMYRALVPNADELLAQYQPVRGGYLIITPDTHVDTLRALARWKHLKGYSVAIIKGTDIVPGGEPTSAQVYAVIQNAYNNWDVPPEFVCLVGDQNMAIPDFPYGGYNSDHEYSCVDGTDYFSDVMVTRLSVPMSMVTTSIAMRKSLVYESTPYMADPNYWRRALSVAGNVYAVTPRLTVLWVRRQLLDHGYMQVDTAFNGNEALIAPSFNNGVNLISYRGWAGSNGWYVPGFGISELDALNNNNKLGVMASLVCGTGNFGASECFGEKWIRMGAAINNWKGGPCFYGVTDGNTHTKWNNPVMIGYYWAILEQGVYNFASAAFLGKMNLYETYPRHRGPGSVVELYFNTYNTLGDPELEIRTGIPQNMTAEYSPTIPVGANMLSVHINGSDGMPLSDAYVNLVKGYEPNEEVFVGGRTDGNGNLLLDFNTMVPDTMFITVTARNYIPHKGIIHVVQESIALNISNAVVDDDDNENSQGNNDGNINPSETIEFALTLRNFGDSITASNVNAILFSADPRISVIVPSQSYGTIAPGGDANSGKFAVQFSDNIPNGEHIIMHLHISSDERTDTAAVIANIKSLAFVVQNINYPDNPDSIIAPGETSQLVLGLWNIGELAGTALTGILTAADTGLTILDNNAEFGDIGINGTGSNSASPFSLQISNGVYQGRNFNLNLELTSSNGTVTSKVFSIIAGHINSFDPIGPDNYGYYLYDNSDGIYSPSPEYNWEEISPSPGTRISFPFETDDDSRVITLPFNFKYYGQDYNYMLVCINGFVSFDTMAYDQQGHRWSNFDNNQIPESGAPRGLIGPFWDDLAYNSGNPGDGVFRYFDAVNHKFILEWKNCYHPQSPGNSPETFQMVIYDPVYYPTPTGDAEIVFQYNVVNNDDIDNWDPEAPGLYCTVGFQNYDNNDGLQYTYDNIYNPGAAILQSGRAIKITTATGLQDPPDITYSPNSFYMFADSGQIKSDTLQIGNGSGGQLSFNLSAWEDLLLGPDLNPHLNVQSQAFPEAVYYLPSNNAKFANIDVPIYPPVISSSGGPDNFGNAWIDSDEPNGPDFAWIDISAIGTEVTLHDDDYIGPINMGITFPFYGNNYSQLFINSNGFVTFTEGSGAYGNAGIPNTAPPNDMIAMLWSDINFNNYGSAYYYHDLDNNRFIVSYDSVGFYSGGGVLYFQVILEPSGRILMQYANLDGGGHGLGQCTVGCENNDGSDGLQISYNSDFLHSNHAILIYSPANWLFTGLASGILAAGHDTLAAVTFDATALSPGNYSGHLELISNDPDESNIQIPVTFIVRPEGSGCQYVVGDINNNGVLNGLDVTYGVGYLKGGAAPPYICECTPGSSWFVAGDVNQNCLFNGLDITYLVTFFKGGPTPLPCPDCPPAGFLSTGEPISTPVSGPGQIQK